MKVFGVLKSKAKPAIRASFLRALWNGWPTSYRMRTCANAKPVRPCVLGCSPAAEDRIEHYAVCPILWRFFIAQLGIPVQLKSRDGFFGIIPGLTDEMILKIATA
eukprot:5959638-Karenia_brevis.AAC.1